ncbi:SANT/Myb-like DNA-binding domain-containing protein [Cohnella sp. GCM10027633]|uniref:SANT/Myb-like DNA-binding domain-containing protein n=1 Tax=unclassified Cohnella TaxID=2636738 RepID=UPI0036285EDB
MTRFYYHSWTSDEDRQLTEIMTKGMNDRKKTLALFIEAGASLGRTAKSCQNRWYEIKAREAV